MAADFAALAPSVKEGDAKEFAGLFAGAGATISNEHDAQQAVMPITMMIILAFIAINGVVPSPNAGWAVIISLIPFFSPLVMTSRLFVTTVPVWQWSLSLVLLGASVLGAAWVAGSSIAWTGMTLYSTSRN